MEVFMFWFFVTVSLVEIGALVWLILVKLFPVFPKLWWYFRGARFEDLRSDDCIYLGRTLALDADQWPPTDDWWVSDGRPSLEVRRNNKTGSGGWGGFQPWCDPSCLDDPVHGEAIRRVMKRKELYKKWTDHAKNK